MPAITSIPKPTFASLTNQGQLGGARVGERPLADVLNKQIRFDVSSAASQPTLHAATAATRDLVATPAGRRLQDALTSAVALTNRDGVHTNVHSISLARNAGGFAALATANLLITAPDRVVPDGRVAKTAGTHLTRADVAAGIARSRRQLTNTAAVTDDFNHLVLGPVRSGPLLSGFLGPADASGTTSVEAQRGYRTLVHELQHTVGGGSLSSVLEEGSADLVATHPHELATYLHGAGLTYDPHAAICRPIYSPEVSIVRKLIGMAGIDTETTIGIEQARRLIYATPHRLAGVPVLADSTATNIAHAIATRRGFGPKREQELAQAMTFDRWQEAAQLLATGRRKSGEHQ